MNEKVTMVTGAAAGIGLVSAEAFAKAGATVVLVDINEPKEQAEKLVSEGYKAVAYRCDVSDTRAVKEMIDWIVATYGRRRSERCMELYALRDYPDAETRRWCHCQYLVSRRCYGVPRTSGLYRLQACGNRAYTYSRH